jgi:hypothetical protein
MEAEQQRQHQHDQQSEARCYGDDEIMRHDPPAPPRNVGLKP